MTFSTAAAVPAATAAVLASDALASSACGSAVLMKPSTDGSKLPCSLAVMSSKKRSTVGAAMRASLKSGSITIIAN